MNTNSHSFTAKIEIIGINPYVFIPEEILNELFKAADRNKSPIPVSLNLYGYPFIQNLVRYKGFWRLYLNTPMRKIAKRDVGDMIDISIAYDSEIRLLEMHPKLKSALSKNKDAQQVFKNLPPSRQKEIIRYIGFLKTEETLNKNIDKTIAFLLGKERFIGRDKP